MNIFKNWFDNTNYRDFAKKNTDKYDIVVTINSLLDLKKGWKVTYPILDLYKKSNEKTNKNEVVVSSVSTVLQEIKDNKRAVVSILGLYNRGKSYILARIFGLNLSSSFFQHTEGLSIVTSRANIAEVLIGLDTKGSQKPVPKGDENKIKDAEATERFLQTLSLSLSDIVLIVVNRLTRDDQSYIKQVKQTFNNNKNIIVVHNLSHVNTVEEINKVIKEEIVDCFEAKFHQIEGKSPYWSSPDGTRHVVIAKDETLKDPKTKSLSYNDNAGLVYNEKTISLLRSWLESAASTSHDRSDLVGGIVNYTNQVIGNYLELKPIIKFDEISKNNNNNNNGNGNSASSTPNSNSPQLTSLSLPSNILKVENNNGNSASSTPQLSLKVETQDGEQALKVLIDESIELVSSEDKKSEVIQDIKTIRLDPKIEGDLKYADIRFNMVGIISDNSSNSNSRVEEDANHFYISLDCTGFTMEHMRVFFSKDKPEITVKSVCPRLFESKGYTIHSDFKSSNLQRPLEWSYLLPSPIKERIAKDLKRGESVSLLNGILSITLVKDRVEDDGSI